MSHAPVDPRTDAFFAHPTTVIFAALQDGVFASDHYDPSAGELLGVQRELSELTPHDSARALEHLADLQSWSWIWQLCPRYHFVLARLHELLDAPDEVAECVQRMRACLGAILDSGDGDEMTPLRTTFQSDQDDVLMALGQRTRYRQLVHGPTGFCDVVTCHDGEDIWFDVSPMMSRRREQTQRTQQRVEEAI